MPALMPSANPLFALGKKKPIFAIEAEKFAPAMPMKDTRSTNVSYDVVGSCRARPKPKSGSRRSAVVMKVEFLPPISPGRYV